MTQEVTLPWPPKECSPNARVHWSKKAKAAKAYRRACCELAREAKLKIPEGEGALHLFLDFYPPDRRARDDDNLTAAFKSGRDGLADALKVDDRHFICHPYVKTDVGGMVKVRIVRGPER
jgi:crossover junction endodeoxyribonuclease RusA